MSGSPCSACEPTSGDDARPDAVEVTPSVSGTFVMGAPAPGDTAALERFAAAMLDTMRTTRVDPAD